jgi:integrase/recombinase XerD
MNRLSKAVRDYVSLRRSLGYKLQKAPGLLTDFVAFLNENKADHITIPLALQWAQRKPGVQPAEAAQRLTCIRGFARYWSAIDSRTQIPPWGLLPHRPKRARPYLYSAEEVERLLQAAGELGGLPGLTYQCVFGLLSVAGLRISEVLNLRREHVDLDQGVLVIVGTKLGKSRLVPIHASTQKMLANYARQRDRAFRQELSYFLVSRRGNRLDKGQVRRIFYRVSRRIGLRGLNASHGPRLHDFRHRFAVTTLVKWYRSGQNVEQRLPVLSTYLGHVHVSDTYWYLTACPELMGWAVKRFEQHWEKPT